MKIDWETRGGAFIMFTGRGVNCVSLLFIHNGLIRAPRGRLSLASRPKPRNSSGIIREW